MELTYDRILDNPDLLSRAVAEAKRERALAMHRLVFPARGPAPAGP